MNTRSWITIRAALPLMAALLLTMWWPDGAGAEKESQAWLGVSLQQLTPSLREAMDISTDTGVLITEVVEDSPAEEAGLMMGDIIMEYDGQTVSSPRRLTRLVRSAEPETEVAIKVLRKSKEKTVRVKMGELEREKHFKMRICGDDDEDELFMEIEREDLLLGMPPFRELWLTRDLWLGIKPVGLTEQLAGYFRVKDGRGVLIGEVFEDSPAEKAGLLAGDVIVSLDGERIEDTMELREEIGEHEEGEEVSVAVVRDGKEKSFQAVLEESDWSKQLAATRKLEKWPHKMHRLHVGDVDEDLIDIYLEQELDEEALEKLEEKLEKLEEKLEKLQEKLEKK